MQKVDALRASVKGHLIIRAFDTKEDFEARQNFEVLLDEDNAVHRENASIMVARVIADRPNGPVYYMYFGDGGATVDPLGNVILNPPNIVGGANLYDPTYFEAVDDRDGGAGGNKMLVRHVTGTFVSYVDIYCIIGKNEPHFDSSYTFNEIGLKTQDDLLVTHITFSPITKDPGRIVEILYTLAVTVTGTAEAGSGGLHFATPGATSDVGSFTPQVSNDLPLFVAVGVVET